MTRRMHALSVLVFVSVLAAAMPVIAQTTGSLRGVVTDSTGGVLPGATVTITSAALIGGTRTAVTNELGVYRFPSLPVGRYRIEVSMQGFGSSRTDDVDVGVNSQATVDAMLSVAAAAETVSVVGESPVVDVTSSSVGQSIKNELLEELPTRRNMYDLIQVQPGMSVDVGDGQSDRVVAYGSNRQSNSWNVDGVEVSGPETGSAWWTVNPDNIEEIQVMGVGAPAEYGNHMGGVFNVVSKSGSNVFHGGASYFFQTDGLTDVNVHVPDSPFTFHRDLYRNFTSQLGGPILKDRMWFFGSYEYFRDASTEPGNDPSVAPLNKSDKYDIKVTTRLGQKHELNGFYHANPFQGLDAASPYSAQSALSGETGHNPAWGGGIQSTLSDKLLLEFRYAGWWSDDVHDSQTGSFDEPFTNYDNDPNTFSGGVGPSQGYPWDYVTWREQAKFKATYYAQNFLKSQHEFKMGVQYSKGSAFTNLGIGPNGTYAYQYGGYLYRAVQDPYQYGGTNQDIGIFLDDSVTVNDKLTLNVGVRYDHNTGGIPDYERLTIGTPSISPAGNFKATGETIPGVDVVNWNLVSPRLGFAYRPLSSNKAVVRGSFGLYYDHNVIGNWDSPAPDQPTFRLYLVDPVTGQNGELINEIASANSSFNPNLKAPQTYQYSIGYEQQVPNNMSLGVEYIYKRTSNLVGWELLGGSFEPFPFTDPLDPSNQFTLLSQVEVPLRQKGNDPGDFPGAENLDYFQRYHGVVLSFNRRYANNWGLSGSYTWSRSEGLIPRMLAQAQFNPFYGSKEGADPNNFFNAEGRLQGDRPHMFRLQGVWMLPWEIQLSTNTEFSSGRAHNRQVRVSGLGQGPKAVIMEPGGSFRYSPIESVDLSFGKRIRLGDQLQLRLEAWVFNLLNSDQEIDFADLQPQTSRTAFTPDQWVKPRLMQLRVGLQF